MIFTINATIEVINAILDTTMFIMVMGVGSFSIFTLYHSPCFFIFTSL